jgi:hypothetical protein
LRQRVRRAADFLDTAHRRCLVEIEFAIVQLAHLGQALAERVESGRLRLELTKLDGKCVEVALGILLDGAEPGVLRIDLLLQLADLGKRAIPRAGHGEGHCRAQRHATGHRHRCQSADPPAHATTGQIEGLGHLLGAGHEYDLHAFPR